MENFPELSQADYLPHERLFSRHYSSNVCLSENYSPTRRTVKPSKPSARRLRGMLLVLGAGFFVAAAPAGGEPVVVRCPVVLITRTPLGEAKVGFPSGTSLEACGSMDGWIQVRRGPFSGWVELKDTDRAPEPGAALPSARAGGPSALREPTPPQALPDELLAGIATYRAVLASVGLDLSGPATILVSVLASLAGLASLAWLRARRKCRATAAPGSAGVPPASSGTAGQPAASTTIPCPHCGAVLPLDSLVAGRTECPSCKGAFICE